LREERSIHVDAEILSPESNSESVDAKPPVKQRKGILKTPSAAPGARKSVQISRSQTDKERKSQETLEEAERRAKKLVFETQEKMLVPITEAQLKGFARFLTPVDYAEVEEERAACGLCAHACCSNDIGKQGQSRAPHKYTVSFSTGKILDATRDHYFCSSVSHSVL